MSNKTSFTAHGDEPVEARIVSWVLGEASAFEAAELERLCEKQPELMVFKRRMVAMHGMIKEAEQGPSEDWKLPAAKREPIEQLIGKESDKSNLERRKKRNLRNQFAAFVAIAACVALTLFVMNLFLYAPAFKELPVVINYSATMEKNSDGADFTIVSEGLYSEEPPASPRPMMPPSDMRRAPSQVTQSQRHKNESRYESVPMGMKSMKSQEDGLANHANEKDAPKASSYSLSSSTRSSVSGKPVEVPTPEIATAAPSVEFGDSVDFGQGWGSGAKKGIAATGSDPSIALQDQEAMKYRFANGRDSEPDPFAAPAEEAFRQDFNAGEGFATGASSEVTSKGNAAPGAAPVGGNFAGAMPEVDALSSGSGGLSQQGQVGGVANGKRDNRSRQAVVHPFASDNDGFLGDKSIASLDEDQKFESKESGGRDREKQLEKLLDVKQEGQELGLEDLPRDGRLFRGMDMSNTQLALEELSEGEFEGKPKKQKLSADFEAEILAEQDPFSTFSLNVSDASFQIAQAAMVRGEQPDPAGIKVEQFYNAFDYGDPAPVSGQPVAGVIEQAAHPVIPGRSLVRVALKTAAAGRSASQPLRLTLLVDQSGSMVREDRREAMNEALNGLSKLLTPNDKVTVIGFSRTSHLLADGLTGDAATNLGGLINQEASEGGTNLEEAIKLGEQLALRHKLKGVQNRIVLFTDGAANLGDADPAHLAEKVVALRQQGIAFDIAGIAADELNDDLLAELARNGNGRYYVVGKGANGDFAKKLAGAFRPAAENVKVQVKFNPDRVSRYKLIGFEKDRLKTEDFRNDAVDAAEMAAEEAGVAVYQVETIADGRGEIGEVSVRFRDTDSREMVERSWTLPYDAGTPAIDRASPSMQLATLSMLVGQKLKGDELSNAIDFNQLNQSKAGVKQSYGSDARVMELLQMIEALK